MVIDGSKYITYVIYEIGIVSNHNIIISVSVIGTITLGVIIDASATGLLAIKPSRSDVVHTRS